MDSDSNFTFDIKKGHNVFAYIFEGKAFFDEKKKQDYGEGNLVIFEDGEKITITTSSKSARFLLVSGKPLNEPVAWAGPIVMNTEEEIRMAFKEFREGTFIKHD